MDKDLRTAFGLGRSDLAWVLLFVALEHIVLAVRVIIDQVISDVPSNIKKAMDRDDFILKNKKNNWSIVFEYDALLSLLLYTYATS